MQKKRGNMKRLAYRRRDPLLTGSPNQSYAHDRSINTRNRYNDNVIRNTQLLLSLITTLLLIGVGLIGFGKRPGPATM